MAETFQFPNGGYDVTIVRKQDIIACINENIIDRELALAIVEQCEKDAARFINEGRWTGLPYIGNVRVPKTISMEQQAEQKEAIEEAKESLDRDTYIMFRRRLVADNAEYAKRQRYIKYVTSMAVNKNKKLYRKLVKEKDTLYATLYMCFTCFLTVVSTEHLNYRENEQQIIN